MAIRFPPLMENFSPMEPSRGSIIVIFYSLDVIVNSDGDSLRSTAGPPIMATSTHAAFVSAVAPLQSSSAFSHRCPLSRPSCSPKVLDRRAANVPVTSKPRITANVTADGANNSTGLDAATSVPPATSTESTVFSAIDFALRSATNMFPLWVFLGAAVAFVHPPSFLWFRSSYIVPTIGIVMLGMGLTIAPSSFLAIAKRPRSILLGVMAQYTIMPSLGILACILTKLPPPLAAGVVLVCVCPGGAASNVVCSLAGADVALSVVLTLCSTILSIAAIPFLMYYLAGTLVPVDPVALFSSTAKMVLFPLALGIIIRLACRGNIPSFIFTILPVISVLGVTLICAAIVAANAPSLTMIGPTLVVTLGLVHAMGGALGFAFGRLFRIGKQASRTVAVEVMMQNSSLAVSLANAHFANPLTAIPGAISATLHSVLGSLLAGFWRLADLRAKMKSNADHQGSSGNRSC